MPSVVRCSVIHSPGSCCHYEEEKVNRPNEAEGKGDTCSHRQD